MCVGVSLHKLTAGSGYDYLTRQVAAHDTTEKGHATLASYYSERGEAPGSWRGRGLAGLGDLAVGDEVTAEQMRALFGAGLHPNMQARLEALPSGASTAMVIEATRLGRPFPELEAVTEFRREVEKRTAAWRVSEGAPARATVPVDVRAEIVNDVAMERFEARIGRPPTSQELTAEVLRLSRQPSSTCAGYDVTFTPVKSVSALWAIAPRAVADAIERAHDAAVDDALRFLEDEALYSRAGHAGVRQIDVHGLIAASFTHRDSRAGDPNLHTHVAIANKVQGLDGKWRSIDGRLIYQARVAVSETYNTQLEAHLREALGIEFAEREPGTLERRTVREIIGIPPELVELWSSRRALIESRQAKLAAEFQTRHHRPPTPAEAIRLAQQATLETREAKHLPRSHEEQRTTWRAQAQRAIGADEIKRALAHSLGRAPTPSVEITEDQLDRVAGEVVDRVARSRASWQVWHLRGEASRRARGLAPTSAQAELLTKEIVDRALAGSIPLTSVGDGIDEPSELRRSDGSSMYEVAGSRLYTSQAVLDAERRIVAAGSLAGGRRVPDFAVEIALLESTANGVTLNDGQARLVRTMATSGAPLQLGLAAAGTGKTTAMRVLTRAWEESGGNVLGLAPSAAAAAVLAEATGQATTIAKLLWDLHHDESHRVDAATLIIVDEAGMADTLSLAELIGYALLQGASIRLIGDDRQLSAIGAGGVLRDLRRVHGAVELDEVLRFVDNGEKAASLALRDGDPTALGWYLDHDRIHVGSPETALDAALQAWKADTDQGLDSLMLASTSHDVAELNRRARQLLAGKDAIGVPLSDGNLAGVGDVILTRRNDRRLRTSAASGFVMNGDRWIVQAINRDGGLLVRHRTTGHRAWLPPAYVAEHVELGYATTIHTAQGSTVDTAHTVLTGTESRQLLYVAMTRGRQANHSYVTTVGDGDAHSAFTPETLRPSTAVEILETVLARDGAARSATSEIARAHDPAVRLADAVNRYRDALTIALEHRHGPAVEILDHGADDVVPGLTECNAWPTLRQRLLAATDGTSLLDGLRQVAAGHRFDDIADPAAFLATLIPEPAGGPLPWLPRIPASVADDARWGPYLTARAQHVTNLATRVRLDALQARPPRWVTIDANVPKHLIGDVAVWRAATDVASEDHHPTGGRAQAGAARHYQDHLDRQLLTATPSVDIAQLRALGQGLDHDPAVIGLAKHLTLLEERGLPVGALVASALAEGPLPAERPAAALYWRIHQHTPNPEPADTHPDEPQADQPSSRPRPEHLRGPSRLHGGPRL